jgi:hypothetical protein
MSKEIIPIERIAQSIYRFRGQKVMLDFDLATLYGAETRILNQAVKRNRDHLAILNRQAIDTECVATTSSQFVMSSRAARYRPYAFTEQGVAMLSSVLNSERAVKVNIAIMRAFVKLRQTFETNRKLARKFSELERHVSKHDEEIADIIEALRQLMAPPQKPRREIGFHVREKEPRYRVRKGRRSRSPL